MGLWAGFLAISEFYKSNEKILFVTQKYAEVVTFIN